MPQNLGYWVDLVEATSGHRFNEVGDKTFWVQALPLGKYDHPVFGEIDVTPERVRNLAEGVKNKVRGTDLDINFDHNLKTTEAAGWIKNADGRSDGLWLLVEWTKDAYQKIKDKAFRYLSAEFTDEWVHPKTGQTHKDVLFGAGLTNRPFIKDIQPINLSELVANGVPDPATDPPGSGGDGNNGGDGKEMDAKKLRETLKLSESATDEEVLAAIVKLSETGSGSGGSGGDGGQGGSGDGGQGGSGDNDPLKLNEKSVDQLLKELNEMSNNPAVKTLVELVEVQQKELKKFHTENREQRIDKKLNELDQVDTRLKIPPATREQLKAVMLNTSDEMGNTVYEAYKSTLKLGVVDMTERGWQPRGDGSPTKRFSEAVTALQKDDPKMGYADAVSQVASEQPKLFEEYRQESFAGRE